MRPIRSSLTETSLNCQRATNCLTDSVNTFHLLSTTGSDGAGSDMLPDLSRTRTTSSGSRPRLVPGGGVVHCASKVLTLRDAFKQSAGKMPSEPAAE